MRALVLVDLDNVLSDRPRGHEIEEFVRDAGKRLGQLATVAKVSSCVICLGANTATAIMRRLTFAALRDAGTELGRTLGTDNVRVELGLALTMPQAVDVLLARLARESPSEEGAGPYEIAALFSDDRGLASSLESELYGRAGWLPAVLGPSSSWRMPDGGRRSVRKPPVGAAKPGGGSPPELRDQFTICIDNGGLASWAGQRTIDVIASTEFYELAQNLDRNPWLLSQVGATTKSLRGIERLAQMPSPAVELGRVSDKDQIEVQGPASCPTAVSGAAGASVGIGAARFKAQHATIASRIPVCALATCNKTLRVDSGVLNVAAALRELPEGICLGEPTVQVSLSPRGSRLVAKVHHPSTEQPKLWWIYETMASSELSFESRLLSRPLVVRASVMRSPPWTSGKIRMALRSPLNAKVAVTVDREIPRGTIGTATHPSLAEPLALFSPSKALISGASVLVSPIHTISRTGLLEAYPVEIWSLPLVVPV